ncbi:MAG: cell division protein FtsA, partial [Oscillospiraceae bacterium]
MNMQENENVKENSVFALDIGTRSVIGVVGYSENDIFHIEAIEAMEHPKRAMLDGQIEDINAVAAVANIVKMALEDRVGRKLTKVCVAAAGRALRTVNASFEVELP